MTENGGTVVSPVIEYGRPLRLLPRSRRQQHRPVQLILMRRADRLFQIVQQFRGGRLVTARTLSERLEVSERTIYRDIADLQSTGDRRGGRRRLHHAEASTFRRPRSRVTRSLHWSRARAWCAFGGAAMARAAEEALVNRGGAARRGEVAHRAHRDPFGAGW